MKVLITENIHEKGIEYFRKKGIEADIKKEIKEDDKKDPGLQLKRVLSFREQQISKKELLFKEFKDQNYENMLHSNIPVTLVRYQLEAGFGIWESCLRIDRKSVV